MLKRLVFDFPAQEVAEFDALKAAGGMTSRSELLRNALRLYQWFAEQRKEGYEVVLRKGTDEKVVEILGAP